MKNEMKKLHKGPKIIDNSDFEKYFIETIVRKNLQTMCLTLQ
jgi:hypothetical protein